MKLFITICLLLGSALLPARAWADHGKLGYEERETWNAPLFTTGAVMFAASYGPSVFVAATSDHQGADRLFVPIAGPWLALSDWGDCSISDPSCDENTTHKVLLVADGIVQAAGVITMVKGLMSRTKRVVPTRVAKTSLDVTPTHNGFVVMGRF